MTEPYSLAFNAAVMTMANRVLPKGWDVAGVDTRWLAPTSLRELNGDIRARKRIVVDGANSESTIFADAEHNYAFRAWHDWTHWRYQCEFDLAGEVQVAQHQIADLAKVYGRRFANKYKPLIIAEVVGQALHHELTGEFPVDQYTFDCRFLATVTRPIGEKAP